MWQVESKTFWYILVSSGAQKTLPLFTRTSVEVGVVGLSSCVLDLQRLPCRIRYCAGSKRITSVVAASPAYGQCHLSPVDTVCLYSRNVFVCWCENTSCVHGCLSVCTGKNNVCTWVWAKGAGGDLKCPHQSADTLSNLRFGFSTQASVKSVSKWMRHTVRLCYVAPFAPVWLTLYETFFKWQTSITLLH